jgi:hypothetical protein
VVSIGPVDEAGKHFSRPVSVGFYAFAYDGEMTDFQALGPLVAVSCDRAGQWIEGGKLCAKRFQSR